MALWSALFARPARTRLATRPSLTLFFLLAGAFLLTLVPHVEQMPLWVSVVVMVAMTIRCLLEVYRLPLPSSAFCGVLAICLLIAVLLQFSTIFGRDAGTAFMAGLLAIKFFELRGPRDVALIIFSCFFVVMSALLYSQVLELFIYCLIMMWVLTALLLRVHVGDLPQDRLLPMLTRSSLIFLQALPLAIFLFLFFPRFSGNLQLMLGANPIGLSDTVKPGTIAQLADDDSEVMRATLTGSAIPSVETMYWRALVLWHYEEGAWTQGAVAAEPERQPSHVRNSSEVLQEITIMPHYKKWLFALDYPITRALNAAEPPTWSVALKGDILQMGGIGVLDHKERYTVTSDPLVGDQVLTRHDRDLGIQLPEGEINTQVLELADQLHRGNPGEQAYILAVLGYFRHGGFTYSTDPGMDGPDWLADFLFKSKTGFCEHFASAFAILMRLEKIPARLVVGYQGGEYNPYSNFYTVKQLNAHAWDEVWFDAGNQPSGLEPGSKTGRWMRWDPTALLSTGENAPISAEAAANAPNESLSIQLAHHRFIFLSGTSLPAWVRHDMLEMELRRQQVEADWDDLVFSYDPEAQNRLAQALGFGRESRSLLLLACLVAAGICVVVFQKWMKRKRPVSPVETLYAGFCRNMAQRGIPRAVWEGPLAYTDRVAEAFPDKREAIHGMGSIVARTRYGAPPPDPSASRELKSLLLLITAPQTASSSRDFN